MLWMLFLLKLEFIFIVLLLISKQKVFPTETQCKMYNLIDLLKYDLWVHTPVIFEWN